MSRAKGFVCLSVEVEDRSPIMGNGPRGLRRLCVGSLARRSEIGEPRERFGVVDRARIRGLGGVEPLKDAFDRYFETLAGEGMG